MIVFLIVGTVFTVLGLFLLLDAYFFRKKARRLRGTVVAYEQRRSKKGQMYTPVVTYEDEGRSHRFSSSISSSNMGYDIGETVEVLVMGDQHSSARIRRNDRLIIALAFFVMGSISTGVALSKLQDPQTQLLAVQILLFVLVVGTYLLLVISKKYRKREEEQYRQDGVESDVSDIGERSEELIVDNRVVQQHTVSKRARLVSLFIGLLLVAGSLYWAKVRYEFMDSAVKTVGLIVDKSSTYKDGTATYAAVVTFETQQGVSQRFTSKVSSSNPSWHVGDKVELFYDPVDPADAMIDRGIWNYIVQIIMALVGAIIVIVSALQYSKRRKKEAIDTSAERV